MANVTSSDVKRASGYAVVALRSGSPHLRSFHEGDLQAAHAMRQTIDVDPLQVVPADVTYAANGNVRVWKSNFPH
jgi:hypothetical protein